MRVVERSCSHPGRRESLPRVRVGVRRPPHVPIHGHSLIGLHQQSGGAEQRGKLESSVLAEVDFKGKTFTRFLDA